MTLQQVAAALSVSVSKVQRMETGVSRVSVPGLRALLEVYGVTDPGRLGELTELAVGAAAHTWRDAFAGAVRDRIHLDYLEYEAAAADIYGFQPMALPRLLQTGEYAHAVLLEEDPERAGARTQLLVRHQQEILAREDPPRQFYVLDEAAILRAADGPGYPGVMRRQLRYLAEVAVRPEVTIEVIPFAAGAHPGSGGPFTILGYDGDLEDVLYLEHAAGGSLVTGGISPRVAEYRAVFERLRQMSPGPEPGAGLLDQAADAVPALLALHARPLISPAIRCRGEDER